MKLLFATRPSALARAQTAWVLTALRRLRPDVEGEAVVISTRGDHSPNQPLPSLGAQSGGKGVFTAELEAALHAGRVHAAVHSLKDLPVEDAPGLVIGCIPVRADPRDVFISPAGARLSDLPVHARIGTSSMRRAVQLAHLRPDLQIVPIRGNVDTRIQKAHRGEVDGVILAAAGLLRLGLEEAITEWLPTEVMLPAPGQGALAVQCRSGDNVTLEILSALEDQSARRSTAAERAFLAGLGAGCSLPVAALAKYDPERGLVSLTGFAASSDGSRYARISGENSNPQRLGRMLALRALEEGVEGYGTN